MRVAIVERDEKVLEELKKGLKRVDPNYELAGIAGNGQSAYEMITVMQPNLVIMDIGITLEEAASQLYVSEEYLSSQFKKETGYNFTETVRKYRIEKIKELLRTTKYKMNQIAGLVGYSDPKYMSKVFKEEEGILPTEYRRNSNGIS